MTEQTPPAAEATFAEIAVRDPLSAVTRKERLYLLAVSMIGIAMVQTGLVPSEISTLGIKLDSPDRNALLLLLALVIFYFLAAFVIYAISDYIARREALTAARERGELDVRYRLVARLTDSSAAGVKARYIRGNISDIERMVIESPGESLKLQIYTLIHALLSDEERGSGSERITENKFQALRWEFFDNADSLLLETAPRTEMAAWVRVFFEFVLPILVGLYASYTLLSRPLGLPSLF